MIDMGVEPYLLSSALIGVVAQRLVRGRGCPECYDSGYKGRAGLHEILEMDGDLQKLIIENPSRDELARHMHDRGVKTLFDDGLDRVLKGVTTIEEISRVINT